MSTLNPRHIAWLFDTPDPSTHYIGWSFFRNAPWHWPPGLNPDYGMAMGSSIVYSDSIPLMALLCKLVAPLFTGEFQYTGIWLLMCAALQGMFAMLITSRLTRGLSIQVLAATFLIVPVIVLKRLEGHYALVGQWTVLWAIYLYIRREGQQKPQYLWAIVASLASLVHLYLTVMVVVVWQADVIRRWTRGERKAKALLMEYAVAGGSILVAMWLAGYFAIGIGDSRTPGAAGAYSMNLLSFVDPRGYSLFLPSLPLERPGQDEGTAYLGLGLVLIMLVAGAAMFGRAGRGGERGSQWRPLVAACLGLWLFAVSPIMTFASHRLLVLPNYWGPVGEVLRASGRMIWPTFYLLVLLAIVTISRRFRPRVAVVVLATALLIQIVDLTPAIGRLRNHFNQARELEDPLKDRFWNAAAGRYRRLLLVAPDNTAVDWMSLARCASRSHMAINYGYFARFPWEAREAANRQLMGDLLHGKLDKDAIYVICRPELVDDIKASLPGSASVLHIDGMDLVVRQ